jgi:hypothetical protein
VVVATYKAENQTAQITSPITIFTPPQDGLFRVTAYVEITKATVYSNLVGYLLYVNDSGTQQTVAATGTTVFNGSIFVGSGGVTPIRATAGTPISIEVTTVSTFTQAVFNVYYTVEAFHSGT